MRNKKVGSVTTDYSYLNQSRNHLNLVTGKENDSKLKIWRKNFATAAIIALASGTTMLFSAHSVKADEVDDITVQNDKQVNTTIVQNNKDQQPSDTQQNVNENRASNQQDIRRPGTGNKLTDQWPDNYQSD